MERIYEFTYSHYDSIDEMCQGDKELIESARKACDNSHAPYSHFSVGAAALLESGSIITGSNQESEVFPAGMCAERTLLFHHQATMPHDRIVAMAIASQPAERECSPCGECRQVMCDVEKRQGKSFRIIMCGERSATVVERASDLLPFRFEL